MSAPVVDHELASLKRSFTIGITIVIILFIALFVGINVANGSRHRPEGTAEHWLAAIGDTTRKGVHAEAVKRAEKDGPVSIAQNAKVDATHPLIPVDTDKKAAFPDLEVGKAAISGTSARVPYLLHQRAKVGKDPEVQGEVLLTKQGSSANATWKVSGITTTKGAGKVPSQGGAPPSRAPAILWLIAIVVGVLVTLAASALVRWAGAGREAVPAS